MVLCSRVSFSADSIFSSKGFTVLTPRPRYFVSILSAEPTEIRRSEETAASATTKVTTATGLFHHLPVLLGSAKLVEQRSADAVKRNALPHQNADDADNADLQPYSERSIPSRLTMRDPPVILA